MHDSHSPGEHGDRLLSGTVSRSQDDAFAIDLDFWPCLELINLEENERQKCVIISVALLLHQTQAIARWIAIQTYLGVGSEIMRLEGE